jgi:hypothetical protein
VSVQTAALKYLVVRRFGTQGKFGVDLDAFINTLLKDETIRYRVLKDFDSMFSEAMPQDDLIGINAMVGE